MNIIKKFVKNSEIIFNPNYDKTLKPYHEYTINLFEKQIPSDLSVNFVFSLPGYLPENNKKTIHVGIQYEHTLVKSNGRGSFGFKFGKIPINSTDQNYLVRIQGYEDLCKYDLVVEYSNLNYLNIQSSGNYEDYLKKTFVVSPLIFENLATTGRNFPRKNGIITTFINTDESRRKILLDKAVEKNLVVCNQSGFWTKDDIRDLYRNTKILVNIRQTDHHDTLEELRILPALMNGCLVVCENCPLKEEVFYKDFIIWADYEDILEKAGKTMENYDDIWHEIFIKNNFNSKVCEMQKRNEENVAKAISGIKND
jgi:hypothetical protein